MHMDIKAFYWDIFYKMVYQSVCIIIILITHG